MSSYSTLTENQRAILFLLLEKYNNSRSFNGTNAVRQSFSCKPGDVFKEYDSDYADADVRFEFECDMRSLESQGLVELKFDKRQSVIQKITAVNDRIADLPAVLGIEDKRSVLDKSAEILKKYSGRNDVLSAICNEQLSRIVLGKKQNLSEDNDGLERLLHCIDHILHNENEILERELSIELFSDSKMFEKEYKTKVCSLLDKHGTYDNSAECDSASMRRELILAAHNVVKNPSYFYFKGSGLITFKNGARIELSAEYPVALRSDSVGRISEIKVNDPNVMTVENLTSFNRIALPEYFYLFLSGYNNSCKAVFLRKMFESNQERNWLHFGDIDPDGFYILMALRRSSGIEFEPFCMGIPELKRFGDFCKPLEANDIMKAEQLIRSDLFSDTVRYMLDNNRKLEQEIISWKMFR